MTFYGAIRKTTILALWTSVCAVWIWNSLGQPQGTAAPYPEKLFLFLLLLSALTPFALVGLSLWRKTLSQYTAPLYAMLQGVFFGFVAVALQQRFSNVVMQVFCLTFAVCITLAAAYRFALIRHSDVFNKKLLVALSGVGLYLAIAVLLPFIGVRIFPLILRGPGAAFSGVIVIFAATTFIAQFDLASKSAEQNHPEYMEWHAAFGLIISMVWLYLEGLRIFVKNRVPNEAHQA
jgi:uncharacterized YccA/Bax inhibitor family protein